VRAHQFLHLGELQMRVVSVRSWLAKIVFVAVLAVIASIAAQAQATDDLAALNKKVQTLYVQGKYAEAIPLAQRSLELTRSQKGSDHLDTADRMRWLASLYQAQGRYAEAEPLHKIALGISEMALGPDHPEVGGSLQSFASLYQVQGRYTEAEALYKRALVLNESALGPDHSDVGGPLRGLASLYQDQRRYPEAEPLFKRALAIAEKALGPNHPDVGSALSGVANLYRAQGRYSEAEPLFRRVLALYEKALGPDHPRVGNPLHGLAWLYQIQGRYPEAEALYKRALAIKEKVLGPEHPEVGGTVNNLAWLSLVQGDWARAAHYWDRSTAIIERRADRGAAGSQASSANAEEASRFAWQFSGLVKVTHRLAAKDNAARDGQMRDMFVKAQWAQVSKAANSLAQMAARSAKGSPQLATLVREHQDLVAEWQAKDKQLIASKSEPSEARNALAEKALGDRLGAIDVRLAVIDQRLAENFPDYAELATPKPASVAEVQAWLRPDEALVLVLDTVEFKPVPEETFVWVVTRTDLRWVRSQLGAKALAREVAALRCGLDASAWSGEGRLRCANAVGLTPDKVAANGDPLPFDLARAHFLYTSLFGEVEDLINGKHLLIVPSGALNALPFQVLVHSLPAGTVAGVVPRQVGRLGAEIRPLTVEMGKGHPAGETGGVVIIRVSPDGPAAAAGLQAGDVLLSIDGYTPTDVTEAVQRIQNSGAHTRVTLRLVRDGEPLELTATLGARTATEWRPLLLDEDNAPAVGWLGTRHALTVLPAVSSLKALRAHANASRASEPFIAFGNPLLTGAEGTDRRAWARQSCSAPDAAVRPRVVLGGIGENLSSLFRGGFGNVEDLRRQTPLPETVDELCAVARALAVRHPNIVVHIGARATEASVKALSEDGVLANARVIHFATHGLVAGETASFAEARAEPALLLTPPDSASEVDDGLLTSSEVTSLKLDADWVILSACNTAAGEGVGGDALSGLARAFFYAGARALLVSHWYVDSKATVMLITKAFEALKTDPKIARAEALRRAMTGMIARGGRMAHPDNWAPFVVVGEGAAAK
jgi:CHAT domain-containing protein/tetratricopeptide (TPR) repeat protein